MKTLETNFNDFMDLAKSSNLNVFFNDKHLEMLFKHLQHIASEITELDMEELKTRYKSLTADDILDYYRTSIEIPKGIKTDEEKIEYICEHIKNTHFMIVDKDLKNFIVLP